VANRFLEMMSETVVGWLLLEQAVIAEAAAAKLAADHPDRAFYEGKRFGALFFAFNVLPGVAAKAQMIAREDRTALDIRSLRSLRPERALRSAEWRAKKRGAALALALAFGSGAMEDR